MAGMARRGSHSARHRAGRLHSDAPGQGSARAGLADSGPTGTGLAGTGLTGSGLAGTGLTGTGLTGTGLAESGLAVAMSAATGDQHVATTAASGGVKSADPDLEPVRPDGGMPQPDGGARRPDAGARSPGAGTRRPGRPARPLRKSGRRIHLTTKSISLICAAVVVIVAGMISVGPTGASVAASVKAFLYDWETGDYSGAAALTTGRQAVVRKALRAAFRQLGAEDLVFDMGPITVGATTATAYFDATVDLGRGLPWQYQGHFRLRRAGSGWLVIWSPSVIAPGLGPHDRLAVITTMPGRAPLLNTAGGSLFQLSPVYEVGVVPGKVTRPAATSEALARATHLAPSDADQMRGLIEAWPPHKFLGLIQLLSPASYQRIRNKLRAIRGVEVHVESRRLFESTVPDVTGQIGTETAPMIANEGEPYRPGTTVGESGLEKEYQAQLAGTPTTQVIVQNRAGKLVRVLHRWPGQRGTPVRTTIDGGIQWAAQSALSGLTSSAAIVATRAGGGQILAVASHPFGKLPQVSPLDGRYQPAQTFAIVSTAALLSWTPGFAVSSHVTCPPTWPVGGQTFSNGPGGARPGHTRQFKADFMQACKTAFASVSIRLSSPALMNAAKGFGIGGPPWRLPLPVAPFGGSIANPGSNLGDKAADAIGLGSVRVSPLDMALAAGVAESGTWSAPTLISPASQRPASRAVFGRHVISQLQNLMLATVKSGAARAAYRPGAAIYGQVGSVPLVGHKGLYANWFVGFRGNVAFTVLVISTQASFDQAASIAGQFASSLPPGSFGHG